MSHTPGSWSVFDDEIVTERTDRHICTVALEDGTDPAEWQANMRLIAAAPDLYDAAKHAVMEWRLHGSLTDSCRVLEAAIKNAERQS